MGMLASPSSRNLLLRNTLMLTLSQASMYVVPLVITPYLARVLGVEQFGLLGIATNIVANLIILSDWGFGLSATREVARNARDPIALRRIFWDTMAAKGLLGLVSLIAVVVIMACLGFSSSLSWIVLAGWLQVVGSILGVAFFLQGLEAMASMVAATLVGRLMVIPLTLLLVHGPSDTMIAIAIGGVSGIVSSALTLCIALRARPLIPVGCTLSGAGRQLRNGWHVFLSIGATTLYTQINVIVLGAAAGPVQAGFLFGAEKLQRAAKNLVGPLSGAFYPRVNRLLLENPDQAVRLVRRLLVVQGAFSFLFFIGLLASAPYLIVLFLGLDYVGAIPALRWLSGTVFLVGLNNVLGIQIMLPFGMQQAFMRILIGSGLFNVVAIGPFSYLFGATGASISILATEVIVTTAMGFVVWRSKIFKRKTTRIDL
jgi:O-antigen/teichoic acid export membrane protein